ncbi:helix-turn-helix transcriptional regulator [uncultured Oscillibacter sp.]|uniref:helix-turn-helix domain-containing protein n=1 Tax=uncultured Oscillibacter sp. TaxID=876091 RepID=UPI00280520FF|nr:helix-turn-helix transcriptional regulator [uncultured Oscillibacter sp.]
MNHFAKKLKELRSSRRIYQRELAEYLQVSIGTYQNYEKGIHEPNIDKLIALADYFKVSLDELVGRT